MALHQDVVDLAELVDSVLGELLPIAKAAEVRLTIEGDTPSVHATLDRVRFRQVVINLGSNAIKYSKPEGGDATVKLRFALDTEGRALRLHVIDQGIGIAPDKQTAVFEAFRQVDQSHSRTQGGTGLGLTISRRLCEQMGLDLTLSSELGVGSTFTIEFGSA